VGEQGVVGKTLGTDLEKQKPTLPLIRTLQFCTEEERQTIADLLFAESADRTARLLPLFEKYDAIDYARQTAQRFVDDARRQINALAPSPARDTLLTMAEFVVQRSN
jgi:octaprenyl-diphosphate synthase